MLIIIQFFSNQNTMTWPFERHFHQNYPYLNTVNNFNSPLFFENFNSNPILKNLTHPFFNFPPQIPFISSRLNTNMHYNYQPYPLRQTIPNQNIKIQHNPHEDTQKNIQQLQSERPQKIIPNQVVKTQFSQIIQSNKRIKLKNLISHNSSLRNDTKNIPKNYGKAMLSYIQKNSRQVKQIVADFQVDYLQFMIFVKKYKSKINTIHDLREMWGQNQKDNKIMKCLRILSYHFMRKKCLPYIFNSRIKNFHTHIKYRKKIMQGIKNPQNFTKIKEF